MKLNLAIVLFIQFVFSTVLVQSQTAEKEIPKLNNPMSVEYLKANLLKSQPRLVLNSAIEKELKKKLNSDPVVKNMYAAIKLNASIIAEKPLLKRELLGRRLLSVSREMLWRINMLGMVYRIEKDENILNRINEEVIAVCNFSDWNPSHYLDVAELALAVAIAIDWTAGALPKSTQKLAINALIENAIKPSWPQEGKNHKWVYDTNNWNQVYHGGLIAASITIAETDPELASKTIHRALNALPNALVEYDPDGLYPEVTFNMSVALKDLVTSASRTFTKDSPTSIIIEDSIVKSNITRQITWQLMTTADVKIMDGGAVLLRDGKRLKLENLSHPEFNVSVVALYPAPLELDKQIKDLKRIEIRIPV